jgi:two-component system, NarL family, sensor kinase
MALARKRPMLWFAGASLLAVVALGFTATAILRRQARREAIRDAKEITRLAGEGIAQPALGEKVVDGDRVARARFDRVIRQRVLKDPVVRVKVWDLDGRIVYSDQPALVGRRFDSSPV